MMSKNIQKAAYFVAFLAFVAVAFFGTSTVASAQYYYDDYDYYGDYGYSDPYDGYYDQPSDWDYYGGWDDYGYGDDYYDDYSYGYGDDCYYYNDCYGYGDDYYDDYSYGYGDDCYYNDCYDSGYDNYYDQCYYYDCYGYDTCGSNCGGGSNSNDTVIDIYNHNVNTIIDVEEEDEYDRPDRPDRDRDLDFDVICVVSDDEVEEGDRVTFEARVRGVDEDDVDFDWSGDVNGNDQEISKRFTREGSYEARVEAEYRGHYESDTCEVDVENEDNDRDNDRDRVTLVSTPPTGTPASGVYLSQVPYTGASDNAKIAGFITMLTLASLGGAYYVVTRKARADRKSFIERFKQDNLSAKA